MKKLISIIILMAGVSFSSKAQHFYASFGVQHNWGVPFYVSDVVYNNYCDYDWVHAARIVRNGRLFYDIVLQRGDLFVEVRVGRHGFVRTVRHWDAYPFVGHACSNVCGFHGGFYRNRYTVYNNYNYGYRYRGSNTVIINNHYRNHRSQNHGNHIGHHKHKVNRHKEVDHGHRHDHGNANRRVVKDRYPERRGTYYSSNKNRGRVDHGKRSSYNREQNDERKTSVRRSGRSSSRSSSRRSY